MGLIIVNANLLALGTVSVNVRDRLLWTRLASYGNGQCQCHKKQKKRFYTLSLVLSQ